MASRGGKRDKKKKKDEVVVELTPEEQLREKLNTQMKETIDIFKAVYYGFDNQLGPLLEDKKVKIDAIDKLSGNTAVMLAAKNGQLTCLKMLMEKEADVNLAGQGGFTALHHACAHDFHEIVIHLLEEGKVNTEAKDNYGNTAINEAARQGHIKTVDILCQKEANMENKNNAGLTPFLAAALNNRGAVCDVLSKRKCEKDAVDPKGNNALHIAAICGFEKLVRQLIVFGVKTSAANNDGLTPDQVTKDKNIQSIITKAAAA